MTLLTATLNNGQKMPLIGLGLSRVEEVDVVVAALQAGYRHLDTAAAYNNEKVVGEAVRKCGIPRSEIHVTTKVAEPEMRDAASALDRSLERLGLEYVDLLLIHWPFALNVDAEGNRTVDESWDWLDTWKVLEKLVTTGKTKAIGVSNFNIARLERIINSPDTRVVPAVNQVELHPLLPQPKLLEYCRKKNILLTAYSPLGSGRSDRVREHPGVVAIAKARNCTNAQVLVSWAVWRGTAVIPKSSNVERIKSNLVTVDLTDEEGRAIDGIAEQFGQHRIYHGHKKGVFDED